MCDLYFLFSSLPKFAQKIGHFKKFSYGPPFAILRKMAILDTIEKLAIFLLIRLFSCGFLHWNNLSWLRFKSILIRFMCDLYFLFFSLPKIAQKISYFWKFSYGPPFAISPKMAILHTIEILASSLLICLFSCGFCIVTIYDGYACNPY